MNTFWGLLILIAVMVAAVFCLFLWKKGRMPILSEEDEGSLVAQNSFLSQRSNPDNADFSFRLSEIPGLDEEEEARMVEITDPEVISRIDAVIPGTLQVIANADAAHAYGQALKSTGQVFEAVLPPGAVLSKSRDMENAVRGFFHGKRGIGGAGNFVPFDPNIGKKLVVANTVNTAMSLSSVVVGQYYMTQITVRLNNISGKISMVSDFLDNEYKSKVIALLAAVQNIASFQVETIENDEERNRALNKLERLEEKCCELLGQASLSLGGYVKKDPKKRKEYEQLVDEADKWFQYQQILLELLGKIGELKFALNLGRVSKEKCFSSYKSYEEPARAALIKIDVWHDKQCKKLGIDTSSKKQKKQGLEAVAWAVPGLINDDLNYKDFPEATAMMIRRQRRGSARIKPDDAAELFDKEVRLIIKENKVYYLPPADIASE